MNSYNGHINTSGLVVYNTYNVKYFFAYCSIYEYVFCLPTTVTLINFAYEFYLVFIKLFFSTYSKTLESIPFSTDVVWKVKL